MRSLPENRLGNDQVKNSVEFLTGIKIIVCLEDRRDVVAKE